MNDEEQKRLEIFERLCSPSFNGTESEDAQDFLNRCQWMVCTTGGAKFEEVVDSARRLKMVRTQEREDREAKRSRGPGNSSDVPSGGQPYHNRGRPYRSAQMARPAHRGASATHGSYSARSSRYSLSALPAQSSSRAPSVQGSSVQGSSGSYSCSRGLPQNLPPFFKRYCYECGELGHARKYCPYLSRGPVRWRSQATTPALAAMPPAYPAWGGAQAARGRQRGEGRSGGGQARFYAIPARLDVVASDARLREEKLYAKFFKCEFWLSSVAFLGHIVSSERIKVDLKKIESVLSWPKPSSVTEIQNSLVLASYYRHFMESFSSIAAPMTKLTQKGAPFMWSDECEESFEKHKIALTTTPVLVLPSALGSYIVYCDASQIGIGCILMQKC
ncbi:uncharacterized protein [Nicotiana tomentosiformis]|uniref:uncharacterized protein n=1 Tax=Nicotiana tomentosiformis TaxID=4098 RepID=UPI00388CA0A3